jgi:hypothetical protein
VSLPSRLKVKKMKNYKNVCFYVAYVEEQLGLAEEEIEELQCLFQVLFYKKNSTILTLE